MFQTIVDGGRAMGLSSSPNPAGGMTALADVYLMTTRYRWAAIPLAVVIQLTGSRLALVVIVTSALLMAMLDRRARLVALVLVAVAIFTVPLNPRDGTRVYTAVAANIEQRLTIERTPEALPSGFVRVGDGPPHNVPVRLAVELGIPAALAWLFLSGRALWRRPSPSWWLLVAILLLAALDYYVWVGPMAGFWWMLVSGRKS